MRVQSFATVLMGPDTLVREGLIRILRPAGFRIVASVSGIDDCEPDLIPHDQPFLLILDVGHYPRAAFAQMQAIRKAFPDARIAVVADYCRPQDVVLAFRAGASSYQVKVMASAALIKVLELVMLGETFFPLTILPFISDQNFADDELPAPEAAKAKPDESDVPQLSIREECILRYLVEGSSNKIIARKISIAEATVKVHVKAILRKVRCHNRTQAAIWAIQRGLAQAGSLPGLPQQAGLLHAELESLNAAPSSDVAQSADANLAGLSVNGIIHRDEPEKTSISRAR